MIAGVRIANAIWNKAKSICGIVSEYSGSAAMPTFLKNAQSRFPIIPPTSGPKDREYP